MDFLFLFLSYLALMLVVVVTICCCSRTPYPTRGAQMLSHIAPECLQRAVPGLLRYIFHTRNRAFVVLHLILQGATYTEYSWEIFGCCRELGFSLGCLLLPYLLLAVSMAFFTLTCVTDPGTITTANELQFLCVYEFDGVMFPQDVRCPTCDVRKPARSKHCSLCDRCVHRFDHHCVWVNNCIGAQNVGYFLTYLATLTASAMTLTALSTVFLIQLVVTSGLHRDYFVDELGRFQAIDTVFLIQYLFLTFPRIVFTLGFVAMLSLILGGYLCFMLYLAATNQTTNEWHRGDRIWCQRCPPGAKPPTAKPRTHRNIYSHGFWANLGEVFLPAVVVVGEERKKR
ncbi:palmitoyltransferase ZDHHC4 [Erinaceus europaeus]|uniref:Palmitoyltransferase n=1 Tax=Erinaceus europaeus TaxID=9365 RepID=A0A1S3WDV8_ERIEU|nr:palmitoyltransferase ZDHHC4 [Erinaceus europaeus]